MPEQRGRYSYSDSQGREDQRRKRGRSPHSQDQGRDDSRQKRTRTPSPCLETRPPSRRPISPHINAAAIFSRVLPEWEIEETTHIPIHMTRCQDCALFASHVASQAQGGALEILNDKQRRHWRQMLEEEFRKVQDESFQQGLKESGEETERLKDELDELKEKLRWCYDRTDDIAS